MNINDEKIDIKDLIDPIYFHKEIKKGLFLSDYQLSILRLNGIKDDMYETLPELIILIENILEEDDDEELEDISKEISEFHYYNNVNK